MRETLAHYPDLIIPVAEDDLHMTGQKIEYLDSNGPDATPGVGGAGPGADHGLDDGGYAHEAHLTFCPTARNRGDQAHAAGSYVTVSSGQLEARPSSAASSPSSTAELGAHPLGGIPASRLGGGWEPLRGSWSALLRLERAVTATREGSAPWSLAYASRRCEFQANAPLSHASSSKGVWRRHRPLAGAALGSLTGGGSGLLAQEVGSSVGEIKRPPDAPHEGGLDPVDPYTVIEFEQSGCAVRADPAPHRPDAGEHPADPPAQD